MLYSITEFNSIEKIYLGLGQLNTKEKTTDVCAHKQNMIICYESTTKVVVFFFLPIIISKYHIFIKIQKDDMTAFYITQNVSPLCGLMLRVRDKAVVFAINYARIITNRSDLFCRASGEVVIVKSIGKKLNKN